MNCENCNIDYCKNTNYCPKTGKDLNRYNNVTLKKLENAECRKCNTEQSNINIYCENCGSLLSNTSSYNTDILNNKNISNKILQKEYLKEKFFISISAVAILSIMALIAKIFLGLVDTDMGKYLSILNIVLGANLAPVEIISSGFMDFSKVSLNMGLVIYLILPIICLSIPINMFIRRKDKLNNISLVKDSISIGLIYGITLGVISILGKQILNSSIELFYTMSIIIKYNFFGVVINGAIIGFIVSYINLSKYSLNDVEKIGFKSFLSILTTYSIILIILILSMYVGNTLGYNKGLISIISVIQLAIYLLEIATFIPIVILGDIISIMNINNISNYLNESIVILIYGSILLNILVLSISGYLMKYKIKDIKLIKAFSIYYAIFMGGIVHISKINTSGRVNLLNILNYDQQISIGGNLIVSIIIAYIYCYIITYLGYKLNKN